MEVVSHEPGSAKLKKAASKQLNGVVEYTVRQPDAKLEVFGFNDNCS